MSLNILKKQVKYCLLDKEDNELIALRKKRKRKQYTLTEVKSNSKYFELQEKYKAISENIRESIKEKLKKK